MDDGKKALELALLAALHQVRRADFSRVPPRELTALLDRVLAVLRALHRLAAARPEA